MSTSERLYEVAEEAEPALVGWRIERLRQSLSGPLAVVAAGGTRTAARLWARLHEHAGWPAWSMSPYELTQRPLPEGTRVLLLSASGRHHDLLAAARSAIARGAPTFAVTCDPRAPLCSVVREAREGNDAIVLPATAPRVGLVSPAAVVPMLVLAAGMYGGGPWAPCFRDAEPGPLPVGRPRRMVVLGAGLAAPAAADFANKCLESGFAFARWTDARDFAHGEFMTVDPADTWVTSFAIGAQRRYIGRFLAFLPHDVQVLKLETIREGAAGALRLLARGAVAFDRLAEAAGTLPTPADLPAWAKQVYKLPVE